MKKEVKWVFIIILLVIVGLGGVFRFRYYSGNIPDNYVAIFHGGVGERVFETYIYKTKNNQDNYGFKYINVTATTKYYGSSEWESKITSRGRVAWTSDVFKVAKENSAYSYVTVPNGDKVYTIEEFKRIFIKK